MHILFPHRKVYVGCSLTFATQEFMDQVEAFKGELRQVCEVLCFIGLDPTVTPRKIYDWDIGHCVANCDLLVAICDHPSTGLGYEMATQVEKWGKPLLAVGHHYSKVTDLLIDTGQPGYSFERYRNLEEDVIPLVISKLQQMDDETGVQQLMPFHHDEAVMTPRQKSLSDVALVAA